MQPGEEPVADDEVVYRRIPIRPEYYDPAVDPKPAPLAFKPRKDDTTGISVSRAKYKTPEEVATNDRGKQFFVAALLVGDLRARGIQVEPRPVFPEDPGHAEITGLNYANRKAPAAKETVVQPSIDLGKAMRARGPGSVQPAMRETR